MSSIEACNLPLMTFKADNLREGSFAKAKFIQWLSEDEFLLSFDKYCLLYRFTPFFISASLTDRFPLSVFHIVPNAVETQTILGMCMSLLNYTEIDTNYARSESQVTEWKDINETMADAVFLQPGVPMSPQSGTRICENEQPVLISDVVCEQLPNQQRTSMTRFPIIIVLADGRAYSSILDNHGQREMVYLTSILYDYISKNADTLRKVLPDILEKQSSTNCTTLQSLKIIRRLGCFLSMKIWLPTELRFPDGSHDTFAISIHRSGHFIFWRYNMERYKYQVFGFSDAFTTPDAVLAAVVVPVDHTKCFVLLGTNRGDILSFSVQLNVANGNPTVLPSCPLQQGDGVRMTALKIFHLDGDRYFLISSCHVVLNVMVITVSSNADIIVMAQKSMRMQSRFAIADVIRFENLYYVITKDKISKYSINYTKDLDVNVVKEQFVQQDSDENFVGLRFSNNGVLRLCGTMRRFFDRYSKQMPLVLHIRILVEPAQFWFTLMNRNDLKEASDLLVVLRAFVLHPDQAKTISELLIRDLESLDSDDNPNVLYKLKVFRFTTSIFSAKRNKADDVEFWQRVREKVERLLLVRVAKSILERAVSIDLQRESSFMTAQCIACIVDFLVKEGMDVTVSAEELARPRCPLCNSDSFQSTVISEHICSKNHRYPACSLSFLPIQSFSYRKCRRCDLPALERQKLSEMHSLIADLDHCVYCDGELIDSSFKDSK